MSIVGRGLSLPGGSIVAWGLCLDRHESVLSGVGDLEQQPSIIAGEGVSTPKIGVRSGAQPGRNFRPDRLAREIQRVLTVEGAGRIEQHSGQAGGEGRSRPAVIQAVSAEIESAPCAVHGSGRVVVARLVSSSAEIAGHGQSVNAKGEFYDTELEMMLCAAML